MIILDAFSGDAIPVHLLTTEAFKIYQRHLQPNGVIAVHVSNRYLNLFPVVAGVAERHSLQMIYIQTYLDETVADAESDWLLLTKNKDFANDEFVSDHASDFEDEVTRPIVWTDHYSNLLSVLR